MAREKTNGSNGTKPVVGDSIRPIKHSAGHAAEPLTAH
jgi:hypothetical protein